MSPEKKIYNSLDVAKFIAALNVVILHTEPLSSVCDTHATGFVSAMVRWAIPFFFCSSAFLFFRFKSDIRKYVIRIIQLYLVWLIIKIPFVYQFFFTTDQPLVIQILSFVKGLLFHETFFGSWYLSASVEAMILLWFLSCRCKLSNKILLILGVLMYVPAVLHTSYFGLIPHKVQNIIAMIPFSNSFFVAFIYLLIGKIIAEGQVLESGKSRVLLCFMVVLFVIESLVISLTGISHLSDAMLSLPLLTFFLMSIFVQTEISISCGAILRKISILIYLIHPVIMYFLSNMALLDNSLVIFFCTLVISIITSLTIVKCSERLNILKFLY